MRTFSQALSQYFFNSLSIHQTFPKILHYQ
nr:MAG TPA: hypothetical protein [Caudoviricetes sp.]